MSEKQPHICLSSSLGIKCAILPGDPARLDRILVHLTDVKELAYNREFRSLSGEYRGTKILALSTGIGGASAGIAVEELHNIGVKAMVRIGSCGALQPGIGLGDLILACGAVRDDGTSRSYVEEQYPAVPDFDFLSALITSAGKLSCPYHVGLVRSHDSFYRDDEAEISAFWAARNVLGCDMETAALFTIGRLRGVRTASVLNNVVRAGNDTGSSIGNYADGESLTMRGETNEILTALEACRIMEEKL